MNEVGAKEAIFRWIFEDHPDGVLVVDGDNKVVSTNRRFADVCGIARVAPAGAGHGSNGGFALAIEELARRLPTMADPATPRDDMVLGDGRVVERDCAPLRAPDGSWAGCVWFFREVTLRREVEANLWAQLDELRRWQEVMVEREWRMAELKREVNDLCERQGEAIRYPSQVEAAEEERSAPTGTAEQHCGNLPVAPGGDGTT